MKRLYLLRHAEASPAPALPMGDFERLLTTDGARAAARVGDFMKAENYIPDFVVSSAAIRTVQTTREVVARLMTEPGMRVSSHVERGLYLASAQRLLSQIAEADDGVSAMLVVGHNPGVAELAQALSHGTLSDHATDYPCATLAVFSADVGHWADFGGDGVRLEKVFTP